jgi:hypothetical protein
VLSKRSAELTKQLKRLETIGWSSRGGKAADGRKRSGGKLPPKYRDLDEPSNVWAGRGAQPLCIMDARENQGRRQAGRFPDRSLGYTDRSQETACKEATPENKEDKANKAHISAQAAPGSGCQAASMITRVPR